MSVRIYKDNVRQSLIRTLVFTDLVLFIFTGVLIAFITYFFLTIVFDRFDWYSFLFVLGILEPAFVVIATLRIDNQHIYKIISRAMLYSFRKKNLRAKEVSPYFTEFKIQDDLIIRRKNICKVFKINPYDISALNEDDRETFFTNLKQTLHILPSQLQIIVKKEVAKPGDFTDHFLNLYKSLPKHKTKKEEMAANYQRELEELILSERFLTIKQYGVFSLSVDTENVSEKVKAIGKLDDMYQRFSSSLESCRVTTRQLRNTELIEYVKGELRG